MVSESKIYILQCPICKSDLSQDGDYLVCLGCRAGFPVVGDIVVLLTKDDLANFLAGTWGSELQKENAYFSPGFAYASNEVAIEDLRTAHDEAAEKGRNTRLFRTGVFPEDPDMPADFVSALRSTRDEVVRLSGANSAERILDWPTGWGYCMHNLAFQADPEALVVALDVNFRTMSHIKPYYDKHGLSDRMLFVVADAVNMPFKDSVFQSVTALGGTCEIGNAGAAFSETSRVLDSDGWFAASGDQYKDNSPSMEIAEQLGLDPLVTRDRVEAAMKTNGFRNLEYRIMWEGYDCWDDLTDEERCPLPA